MTMLVDQIKTIAVVGAGNMGHQISVLCALKGFKTFCTDISAEVLAKAQSFAETYLPAQVSKGKITEEQAKMAMENLVFTPDLSTAVKGADYVIEAVVEVLEVKRRLFAQLDKLAPPHAILATNSSYIVSSKIADVTARQDKVLNLHFFNPALVMKLVEVVQGPHVSEESARLSVELSERLDKVPVWIRKEVEGFLLNRIIRAIRQEALWLLEMGVATYEDIDKACVYGAGHPMGPFRLMDLTGIDLHYTMAMERFRATGNPSDLPPPSVVEKFLKGEYGQKTGKGWYQYTKS